MCATKIGSVSVLQRWIKHLYALEIHGGEDTKETEGTHISDDICSPALSSEYSRPVWTGVGLKQE